MDIAELFDYEKTYSLDLKHPVSGDDLGVTFFLYSSSNPKVKRIVRDQIDTALEDRRLGRQSSSNDIVNQEVFRVAAHIAGWDWGDHLYDGKTLAFTPENAARILQEQDWIYAQVAAEPSNLENFTKASSKT